MLLMALAAIAAQTVAPSSVPAAPVAPSDAPRPDGQMGAMIGIFDMLCLRTFPDEDKIATAMAKVGATPLTPDEVKVYLRDDPGRGWRIGKDGRTIYTVTLEAAPIRACAMRSMTTNGLIDDARYDAVIATAEARAGGGFVRTPPFDRPIGEIRTRATGSQKQHTDRSAEAFYLIRSTPVKTTPTTATEVRMVHQLVPAKPR